MFLAFRSRGGERLAGAENVIEISKYQLNIRPKQEERATAMAAAVAEVDGSQWNYLLCFHFVQLTHRQCVCVYVCVCVLEALKLFVVATA